MWVVFAPYSRSHHGARLSCASLHLARSQRYSARYKMGISLPLLLYRFCEDGISIARLMHIGVTHAFLILTCFTHIFFPMRFIVTVSIFPASIFYS